MKEVMWYFHMSNSDGEVSEELSAEENSHLGRSVASHGLIKLLLREPLKGSPVFPENYNNNAENIKDCVSRADTLVAAI